MNSSSDTPVAGLLLAGGRSRRFGGEKAAAVLDGRTLLARAAEPLLAFCGQVAVSARPGSQAERLAHDLGLPVLHDAPGDADGPLAGVRAGLTWANGIGAAALATSPCDAPFLPPDLFGRLNAARSGGRPAMARAPAGLQPLCAIWPVGALPAVTRALQGGAHPPVHAVLSSLGAGVVEFFDDDAFSNLNRRQDLQQAEARLARGRPDGRVFR